MSRVHEALIVVHKIERKATKKKRRKIGRSNVESQERAGSKRKFNFPRAFPLSACTAGDFAVCEPQEFYKSKSIRNNDTQPAPLFSIGNPRLSSKECMLLRANYCPSLVLLFMHGKWTCF